VMTRMALYAPYDLHPSLGAQLARELQDPSA
jgi:hypothetical protein